jgi:hypothetical protein
MDQVITSLKWHFWADILRILADEDDTMIALWKEMMMYAIYSVSQAWSSMNTVMLV